MLAKKTKVEQPITYADRLAKAHEWVGQLRRGVVPPNPTYSYSVGEAVKYGNLQDCRVEEILDGGLKLHLSHAEKGTKHGVAYDHGRFPVVVWWNEVSPLSTTTDTQFARERMRVQYLHTDLRCFVDSCYHRGLFTNPDYQREYVWTMDDKLRLIKSIFNRCDIGKFVVMSDPLDERWEVVDGKQRLSAIMQFMEGRYAYEGKTWYELSDQDKYSFRDLAIQYCDLDNTTVKRSEVLWLFLNINAAGVPQTEEHIAKAQKLYQEALEEESLKG